MQYNYHFTRTQITWVMALWYYNTAEDDYFRDQVFAHIQNNLNYNIVVMN